MTAVQLLAYICAALLLQVAAGVVMAWRRRAVPVQAPNVAAPEVPHAALRMEARDRCASCHAAPSNDMHRNRSMGCAQCHRPEAWKPASFDHASLPAAELARCETCHKAPANTLHRQIKGDCAQCHTPSAWRPATFEHDKLFVLDRNHNVPCATCHTADDYRKYTCYGCHAHTPANVRRKHVEEGIPNFENCVECHRSADGESEGKGSREDEGDRTRRLPQ